MLEVNKIHVGNCLDHMRQMPDGFVDLTVTSPPYDNLRTYNGYEFDFEPIARELYRVTKKGGVVVWVVGDATINGSETGTSFRQALYFKEIGFNLHDTMIYERVSGASGSVYAYWQDFEYMFVFTKGVPVTRNLLADRLNVAKPRERVENAGGRRSNGDKKGGRFVVRKEYGIRSNVWRFMSGGAGSERFAYFHPAVFPEALARDHILSWSNENDLVYDPFGGSMTTAKAAHQLNRRWIMSEISAEYCELGAKRLEPYLAQESLF